MVSLLRVTVTVSWLTHVTQLNQASLLTVWPSPLLLLHLPPLHPLPSPPNKTKRLLPTDIVRNFRRHWTGDVWIFLVLLSILILLLLIFFFVNLRILLILSYSSVHTVILLLFDDNGGRLISLQSRRPIQPSASRRLQIVDNKNVVRALFFLLWLFSFLILFFSFSLSLSRWTDALFFTLRRSIHWFADRRAVHTADGATTIDSAIGALDAAACNTPPQLHRLTSHPLDERTISTFF